MNAPDRRVDLAQASRDPADRVAAIDAGRLAADLDAEGWARLENLVSPIECDELAALYGRDEPVSVAGS